MDIAALQTFVEVMRRGSFAAVAKARNIDPSSVSRAISALEVELGVRLFQRTTRRITPTEAATVYFERVDGIIDELEQARLLAHDASATLTGTLRITTSVAFGNTCVVPALPLFRAQCPGVGVHLITTDANVDLVAERIDVAVRLGPRATVGYIGHKLVDTRYRVVASKGYLAKHRAPKKPSDLANHDCLRLDLPGFRDLWRFRSGGVETTVEVRGSTTFTNVLAMRDCTLADMGPALLVDWLLREHIRDGTLVDLFPRHEVTATDYATAAWLLYPSRAFIPAKVRAFAAVLKQHLAELGK